MTIGPSERLHSAMQLARHAAITGTVFYPETFCRTAVGDTPIWPPWSAARLASASRLALSRTQQSDA